MTLPNVDLQKKALRGVILRDVIQAIEQYQSVINKADLDNYSDLPLKAVASLASASQGTLSFLAKKRHSNELATTQASVVLVADTDADSVPAHSVPVVVASPYLAYASASQLFEITKSPQIHHNAVIGDGVVIGDNVTIGANTVIGDGAVIGDNVTIGANTVIGDGAVIGAGSLLEPLVFVGANCVIGRYCRIHSHASLGAEGFGFAPSRFGNHFSNHFNGDEQITQNAWVRIAQLGRVVIGDNVRIGANTCIDRGAIEDTVIDDNVIIDNLVQIAHNVRIGTNTAIAAKTGIAGSTQIGKDCVIGGATAIAGHIKIADGTTITATSFVTKSIDKAGVYSSGTVAMPNQQWRRAAIKFRQLGKQ